MIKSLLIAIIIFIFFYTKKKKKEHFENSEPSPTESPVESPVESSLNTNNIPIDFIIVFNGNLNNLSRAERERFIEQVELFLVEDKGLSIESLLEIFLSPGSIKVNITLYNNEDSRDLVRRLTTPGNEDYISPQNQVRVDIGGGRIFTSHKTITSSQISGESQATFGQRVSIDMGEGDDILQYGVQGNANIFPKN